MLLDPMQDSVTSVWNFEIPVDNYFNSTVCEPNCGLQALRINYGYGEYAISPCTSFPLWVSQHTPHIIRCPGISTDLAILHSGNLFYGRRRLGFPVGAVRSGLSAYSDSHEFARTAY